MDSSPTLGTLPILYRPPHALLLDLARNGNQKQDRPYNNRHDDDIFYTSKQTDWILRKINEEFSRSNLALLNRYKDVLTTSAMAKITALKQLKTIYYLTKLYGKEWQTFDKEDSIKLVARIMEEYSKNGQETSTTFDFKKILKLWIRWIHTGHRHKAELDTPDPESIRWIKTKKVKNTIAREDLLTEDDRTRLIHACSNARDRALIDVHLEAGTRPGEILSLDIKHVKVDNIGDIIKVEGKTGQRQIRIVRSVKILTDWLNVHPFKDNPNSPLFLKVNARESKRLSYISTRNLIRGLAKKARNFRFIEQHFHII